MIYVLTALVVILLIVTIFLFVKFNNSMKGSSVSADDAYKLSYNISEQFLKLEKSLKENINTSFKGTEEKIKEFNNVIYELRKGQDNLNALSEDILSLEKVLGNNKETGNFGEALLEQVLCAYFGEDKKLYDVQHKLGEHGTVDACIFMPNETICIDSKFPVHFYKQYLSDEYKDKEAVLKELENAVIKQIKEISSKYIVDGVTPNYACMFVPSDSLLALIHNKLSKALEAAKQNKIVFLSPSTAVSFIASLKVAKMDYEKNMKAKDLYLQLDKLGEEFKRLNTRWNDLSKANKNVVEQTELLDTTFNKITKSFEKISNMDLDDDE